MQATTKLPLGYRGQAALDWTKEKGAFMGVTVLSMVLSMLCSWLIMEYLHIARPVAFEALGIEHLLTATPDGLLEMLPIKEIVLAFVLGTTVHELVHGVSYWWFGRRRPIFGLRGLAPYTASPRGVFYRRNHYLMVGIAPLVVLTLGGLLAMLIVPVVAVPIVGLLIVFNAAGAAGDVLGALRLLSYPPDTLMQDHDTGLIAYRPRRRRAQA